MKRTFVTFAVGEIYEKLSKVLKSSIDSFSEYGLIIYTPDDFDIEYNSELWNGPRSINFSYKILSCLKALETYDEVVWLDNDCVVTYNIDKIWNNKIEKIPLLPRHRFYNFERWPHDKVNYRDSNLLIKAKEKVGLNNDFENNYLQACCMLFNKDCKDFFDEVMYYYQDYDSSIFPFGDETIINLLIWKNNYKPNLGDVSLCSYYFSPYKIDEFINLKNADDYPKLFDLNYIGFPNNNQQENQYANHNRLGLIENNFEDILFFHGSKSYELHNSFLTKMINRGRNRYLPYMNSEEISDLITYIDKDSEVLEIGCGNSTLFFSKIVKRLVSIEHTKEWGDKISNDMKLISKCDWSIHVVEPNFPQSHPFQPAEPGQFDEYVNFISNLEKNQFDVILVDGRDRVRCTTSSIPLLKKGGVLIIHDFWNRPKYHSVLQLPELELIKDDNSFENTENTLVAFRKK
jgi:hypothetical protein